MGRGLYPPTPQSVPCSRLIKKATYINYLNAPRVEFTPMYHYETSIIILLDPDDRMYVASHLG